MKNKKTLIYYSVLIICIALTAFLIFKNNNNSYSSYTTITELKVLDKYKDHDTYYWKIDLHDEFIKLRKYGYLDNTIRTFEVDPEFYNKVNADPEEDILGVEISFHINNNHPLYDDDLFKNEPLISLLNPAFNDFNKVTKLFEPE